MPTIRTHAKFRRIANISLFIFLSEFASIKTAAADCITECSNGTPYCLSIPKLVAGQDIPWAMRALYRYVSKQGTNFAIKSSDMLSFFRMKDTEDPCRRGSTNFDSGTVQNTGANACRISLKVTTLGAFNDLNIGFDVPPDLKSSVGVEGGRFVFVFSDQNNTNTPTFWIDNADLNSDWGGLLREFTFAENEVIVSTQNGCLSYKY